MRININDIKINPGRREVTPEDVQQLSESRVPDAYKLHLAHYREILSPEQIKAMIGIAQGSIKMLQDYVVFLNNELEVSE